MTIKAGDRVMVIKPSFCCGSTHALGMIFVASDVVHKATFCRHCKYVENKTFAITSGDVGVDIARLKKIDPPEDGDSLPTRKDTKVPA